MNIISTTNDLVWRWRSLKLGSIVWNLWIWCRMSVVSLSVCAAEQSKRNKMSFYCFLYGKFHCLVSLVALCMLYLFILGIHLTVIKCARTDSPPHYRNVLINNAMTHIRCVLWVFAWPQGPQAPTYEPRMESIAMYRRKAVNQTTK